MREPVCSSHYVRKLRWHHLWKRPSEDIECSVTMILDFLVTVRKVFLLSVNYLVCEGFKSIETRLEELHSNRYLLPGRTENPELNPLNHKTTTAFSPQGS
jgi:hypothetical protein